MRGRGRIRLFRNGKAYASQRLLAKRNDNGMERCSEEKQTQWLKRQEE